MKELGDGKRAGQDRHSRRQRLHGCRAAPPPGRPSARRDPGTDRRAAGRQADRRGVPAARDLRPADAGQGRGRRRGRPGRRVLLPAARDHPGDRQGSAARPQGGRPLGRLPAARPRALRPALRPRPSGAGAAGAGGLRPDRALPRRHPRQLAGGQPGLLHHHGRAAADPAAARAADPDRRHRHRRQVGGERGRARRQAGQPVHRGRRRHPRLRRRHAPAHAGDRAVPGRLRRAADAGHLHAAPDADEPGHPGDDLRPARGRGGGRRPARDAWRAPTPTSRSSTCCRSRRCPPPATSAAPTCA